MSQNLSRRRFLKAAGAGLILPAAGCVSTTGLKEASQPPSNVVYSTSGKTGLKVSGGMNMSIEEYNKYGEALEQCLFLRDVPISVKMINKEEDIPEGTIRPKKDKGHHLAQCQAFALARRQKQTVAMLKEDHWCFAALIAYGLVDDPEDEFFRSIPSFPTFERDKYIGTLTGPMSSATFEPDLVMIYAEPAQIRKLLIAVMQMGETSAQTSFQAIDSCSFAVVPTIQNQEYRITIPDPGEYARSAVREDELIFSIPKSKIAGIVSALKKMKEAEKDDIWSNIELAHDFRRPDFYNIVFKQWGLDTHD